MTVRPPPPPPPLPPLDGGATPLPSFDEALPSFDAGTPLPAAAVGPALPAGGGLPTSRPPPPLPSPPALRSTPPPPPLPRIPSVPPSMPPPAPALSPPATPAPRAPSAPPLSPAPASAPTQPLATGSSAPPGARVGGSTPAPAPPKPARSSAPPQPRRGVPVWLAILAFGLGAAVGLLIAPRGVAGRGARPVTADSAATASSARSTRSAATAPAKRTVEELASAGDEDALATLNGVSPADLTLVQSLALSRGEVASRLAELAAIGEKLKANPEAADDPATLRELLKLARDPQTTIPAQELIAAQGRASTTDLLFEIWTGVTTRDPTTILAERLVLSNAVRKHASPALAVALALRDVQDCEEATALIAKAAEVGDRRSVRALVRLNSNRGCGDGAREDCFPCLRTVEARRALATAAANAQRRDPPRF
ncbi:MAG TPA: hypothetical protein PLU22_06655 [Polyangiaceae bacterium]|nr:hypothetical protein [Polyangiaceae bacterium]